MNRQGIQIQIKTITIEKTASKPAASSLRARCISETGGLGAILIAAGRRGGDTDARAGKVSETEANLVWDTTARVSADANSAGETGKEAARCIVGEFAWAQSALGAIRETNDFLPMLRSAGADTAATAESGAAAAAVAAAATVAAADVAGTGAAKAAKSDDERLAWRGCAAA